LYAFFWVIPRCLNFICRGFGTFCLFHIHRRIGYLSAYEDGTDSVPKRRHINFRRQGITEKKAYGKRIICCDILVHSLQAYTTMYIGVFNHTQSTLWLFIVWKLVSTSGTGHHQVKHNSMYVNRNCFDQKKLPFCFTSSTNTRQSVH